MMERMHKSTIGTIISKYVSILLYLLAVQWSHSCSACISPWIVDSNYE
jgi:hypothetical protein